MKFPIGKRVQVMDNSGVRSGWVATVVRPFDWRLEEGAYSPVRPGWAYLKTDDGILFTMPRSRLKNLKSAYPMLKNPSQTPWGWIIAGGLLTVAGIAYYVKNKGAEPVAPAPKQIGV